jgi:hypothetical protein
MCGGTTSISSEIVLLNAAAIDAYPSADVLLRNPTAGMVDSCVRAASGHAAAPAI